MGCARSRNQGPCPRDDGRVDSIRFPDRSPRSRPSPRRTARWWIDGDLLHSQGCWPHCPRLLDRGDSAQTLGPSSPSDQPRGLCRCSRFACREVPAGGRRNHVDLDLSGSTRRQHRSHERFYRSHAPRALERESVAHPPAPHHPPRHKIQDARSARPHGLTTGAGGWDLYLVSCIRVVGGGWAGADWSQSETFAILPVPCGERCV